MTCSSGRELMWEMSLVLQALWSPGLCLNPAIVSLQHPTPLVSVRGYTYSCSQGPLGHQAPSQHALPIAMTWLMGWRGVAVTKRLIF